MMLILLSKFEFDTWFHKKKKKKKKKKKGIKKKRNYRKIGFPLKPNASS